MLLTRWGDLPCGVSCESIHRRLSAHLKFVRFFKLEGMFPKMLCLLTLCLTAPVLPLWPQEGTGGATGQATPIVERIDFDGNRRIRSEALRTRIFTRPGDPYSEAALRRDFRALWNTQFFDDIRLEVEDSPNRPGAKIVVFHLVERPIIRRIEYKGNKSVSQSDILDRFKDRKVGLSVESQFDPTRVKRAEVVLKELLAEHGHQFATVKPAFERVAGTNAVTLIFNMVEGPKVKVGNIVFKGNTAFSARRIIRTMRNSRPYSIPLGPLGSLPVMSKTYDRDKLNEDLEIGVRGLYQDNGYFKVLVKDAEPQTIDINRPGIPGPWPLVGRKHGKASNITISIEEGQQYRMGTFHVRSSDPEKGLSMKVDALESIFPIKKGEIFSVGKVRKAIENYTKLYGNFGFIDFTAEPETDVHDDTRTIDLTMIFNEEKQFFVRRIEFSGNTATRDKVIRREILLSEGDMFRNNLWEISLLRLNQLDYFERVKPENAELKRNVQQGTIDILLKLKEKGKQSISLTGGVSGLAGSYLGLSYQTNNFIGLGETLTLSGQFGTIQRSALFGFSEPYLFDRPISSGFTIFDSQFRYNQQQQLSVLRNQQLSLNPATEQNYNQNSKGATIFASYPLRKFSFARVGVTYGFTDTNITGATNAAQVLFQTLQFSGLSGPSALNGIHSSKITPTFTFNTVDNPINPTHGKSYFYSLGVEGLGGNTRSITQIFEGKYFRPVNKHRNVLGFRLQASFATGYGGKEVAPYGRFLTGGEQTIRGFYDFSISPVVFVPVLTSSNVTYSVPNQLGSGGVPVRNTLNVPVLTYTIVYPGGDTSVIGNVEYRIPLAGPVSMTLFLDAGINGVLLPNQLKLNSVALAQLQTTFPNTTIPATLQLAPGSNFAPRTSTGVEFVVHLPIVQAPFRLYWAYNPTVYSQVVTAPNSAFNVNNTVQSSLPPGVYAQQIVPTLDYLLKNPQQINFHERRSTFRFTVSRTF
jgi:outer membrane protein insertion porin family